MADRDTPLRDARRPASAPQTPPIIDPIPEVTMPDEPVDEIGVELRAGGVTDSGQGHLVGSAQPLGVDVGGPGPVSTAPAPGTGSVWGRSRRPG